MIALISARKMDEYFPKDIDLSIIGLLQNTPAPAELFINEPSVYMTFPSGSTLYQVIFIMDPNFQLN